MELVLFIKLVGVSDFHHNHEFMHGPEAVFTRTTFQATFWATPGPKSYLWRQPNWFVVRVD